MPGDDSTTVSSCRSEELAQLTIRPYEVHTAAAINYPAQASVGHEAAEGCQEHLSDIVTNRLKMNRPSPKTDKYGYDGLVCSMYTAFRGAYLYRVGKTTAVCVKALLGVTLAFGKLSIRG